MDASDWFTLILAMYGAGVSTALAIKELGELRRRIKIILEYIAFEERARVRVINVGQRPITIREIGLSVYFIDGENKHWEDVPMDGKYSSLQDGDNLPKTIEDGEEIVLNLSEIIGGMLLNNNMNAKINIYDVEGHNYKKFERLIYDPKWGKYEKFRKRRL